MLWIIFARLRGRYGTRVGHLEPLGSECDNSESQSFRSEQHRIDFPSLLLGFFGESCRLQVQKTRSRSVLQDGPRTYTDLYHFVAVNETFNLFNVSWASAWVISGQAGESASKIIRA